MFILVVFHSNNFLTFIFYFWNRSIDAKGCFCVPPLFIVIKDIALHHHHIWFRIWRDSIKIRDVRQADQIRHMLDSPTLSVACKIEFYRFSCQSGWVTSVAAATDNAFRIFFLISLCLLDVCVVSFLFSTFPLQTRGRNSRENWLQFVRRRRWWRHTRILRMRQDTNESWQQHECVVIIKDSHFFHVTWGAEYYHLYRTHTR